MYKVSYIENEETTYLQSNIYAQLKRTENNIKFVLVTKALKSSCDIIKEKSQ